MKKGTKWYQLTVVEQRPADEICEASTFKYVRCIRATSVVEAINTITIPWHPTYTVKRVDVKVAQVSGKRRLRKYRVYTGYLYDEVEAPSEEDAVWFSGLDEAKISKVEEVVEEFTDYIL